MSGVEIEMVGLSCRYGVGGGDLQPLALRDFGLTAPSGRVTALVGPSGAGKSTLLRAVAGLLVPDAGDVRFDGESVLRLPPERRDLGMVFQSYALFPHLTVAANVSFGLEVRGVRRSAARRQVAEVLARLEIGHLADRLPHQLSGGEKQRVALARALAARPRALLLDEPLAALDARLRLALRSELAARLRGAGLTALYVTHDQEEAMVLGDRVAVLRAGRLEQEGTPEELYRHPSTPFVAAFIGEGNFLPVSWHPAERRLSGPLGDWVVGPEVAGRLGAGIGNNGEGRGRLLVRPEGLRPAEGAGGHLRSVVRSVKFLGDRRRLEVEAVATGGLGVGGGAPLHLKVDLSTWSGGAPGASLGDPLPLAIDFTAAVLLPDFDPDEVIQGAVVGVDSRRGAR